MSGSPPLPPFRVSQLRDNKVDDIQQPSSPRDGIINGMRRSQYRHLITTQPDASLTYLDEDGDLIRVGSSFELDDRLQDHVSLASSDGNARVQNLHTFDIDPSTPVVDSWKKIQQPLSSNISRRNSRNPHVDPKSLLDSSVPNVRLSDDGDLSSGASASGAILPTGSHISSSSFHGTAKHRSVPTAPDQQPLMALFEAELSKLANSKQTSHVTAKQEIASSSAEATTFSTAFDPPISIPNAPTLVNHNTPGEVVGRSLKTLFEGVGLLASTVLENNSDLHKHVVAAHQTFPQNLEKALKVSASAIDSLRGLAPAANHSYRTTPHASDSTSAESTQATGGALEPEKHGPLRARLISRCSRCKGLINYQSNKITTEALCEKCQEIVSGKSAPQKQASRESLESRKKDVTSLPRPGPTLVKDLPGLPLLQASHVVARRYITYGHLDGPRYLQYLVHWVDRPSSQDVWYDHENLNDCQDIVRRFERSDHAAGHISGRPQSDHCSSDLAYDLHSTTADRVVPLRSNDRDFTIRSSLRHVKAAPAMQSTSKGLSDAPFPSVSSKSEANIDKVSKFRKATSQNEYFQSRQQSAGEKSEILLPCHFGSSNENKSKGQDNARHVRHAKSWHPAMHDTSDAFRFSPSAVLARYPSVSQIQASSQYLPMKPVRRSVQGVPIFRPEDSTSQEPRSAIGKIESGNGSRDNITAHGHYHKNDQGLEYDTTHPTLNALVTSQEAKHQQKKVDKGDVVERDAPWTEKTLAQEVWFKDPIPPRPTMEEIDDDDLYSPPSPQLSRVQAADDEAKRPYVTTSNSVNDAIARSQPHRSMGFTHQVPIPKQGPNSATDGKIRRTKSVTFANIPASFRSNWANPPSALCPMTHDDDIRDTRQRPASMYNGMIGELSEGRNPHRANTVSSMPNRMSRDPTSKVMNCINSLKDMGFTIGDAEIAAESVDGDLQLALDILDEDHRASRQFWGLGSRRDEWF